MKKPTFIISFDCEAKFGMADNLTAYQRRVITNAASNDVYRRLLAMLDEFGLKATFAFVGAYTLSYPEVMDIRKELRDVMMPGGRRWLEEFWRDFTAGRTDGWLNPEAMELVKKHGGHEIGSHGFTHAPLSVDRVSFDFFRHELIMAMKVARSKGVNIQTIIYPRNQVGYTPLLPALGLTGYRAALRVDYENFNRRVWNITSEFNFNQPSQPHSTLSDCAIAIPSGYILNAHNTTPRRAIPRRTTVRRWCSIIDHAIAHGQVAHLWSHPHNFITDPSLFTIFRSILQHAAPRVRGGELGTLTQDEYCRELRRSDEVPGPAES